MAGRSFEFGNYCTTGVAGGAHATHRFLSFVQTERKGRGQVGLFSSG